MTGLWRAWDVPRGERLYYMRHAVSELMGSIEMRYANKKEDFPGWLHATDLGALRIIHGSAPQGEFARTPQQIRQSHPDLCGLWWPNRHHWTIEQDDRQVSLEPGAIAFVDLAQPFRFEGRMHDFGSVLFPKALLALTHDEIRQLACGRFSGTSPYGALISPLVRQLARDIHAYHRASAARIGSAALELIAGVLTASLDRPTPRREPLGQPSHHAMLLRVHTFIQDRLGDPDLSPVAIAAAQHISLRQLYKLFAAQGQTVAGWVRNQRLRHCRRDLLDPALCHTPVSRIGARWGFSDATNFSRAFRRMYGVPPSQFRALGLRPSTTSETDTPDRQPNRQPTKPHPKSSPPTASPRDPF